MLRSILGVLSRGDGAIGVDGRSERWGVGKRGVNLRGGDDLFLVEVGGRVGKVYDELEVV